MPPAKLCMVCGDKALGYNFNAVTCESCKAFFRRNALIKKQLTCPFKQNCEITVVTRRFCQRCRLKKCFDIGMKSENIMSEEDKLIKRRKIENNRAKRKISQKFEDDEITFEMNEREHHVADSSVYSETYGYNNSQSSGSLDSGNGAEVTISKSHYGLSFGAETKLVEVSSDTLSGPEIVEYIVSNPDRASQAINLLMRNPAEAVSTMEKIINSQSDALRLISHLISYPGDALKIISKVMNSPFEALTVFTKFMSSPTDALEIISKIVDSPQDVLHFVKQLMDSPGDALTIMNKFMNTPAEALKIINKMVNGSNQPKKTTKPLGEESKKDKLQTSENTIINSMLGKNSSTAPPTTGGSKSYQQNHSPSECSGQKVNEQEMPSTSMACNNSDKEFDVKSLAKNSLEKNVDNALESVLFEVIRIEYQTINPNPEQSAFTPSSASRDLNEAEQIKLSELRIASEALYYPVDEDLKDLVIEDERIKPEDPNQDPKLLQVVNLTAVAIKRLIKMAKKIAAFRNMCQEDQVALLKGGCTEMMIMRSVMSYDGDRDTWKIPHSKGDMSNIKTDVLKLAKGNVYEEHGKFIRTFDDKWRMDDNIILIMCAIVLFTPTRAHVIHSDVIKLEQNSYYYLLRRYLESVYLGCEAKSTFIKLVQKISDVERLNQFIIGVYLNVNPSQVEPLLREIFDLKYH